MRGDLQRLGRWLESLDRRYIFITAILLAAWQFVFFGMIMPLEFSQDAFEKERHALSAPILNALFGVFLVRRSAGTRSPRMWGTIGYCLTAFAGVIASRSILWFLRLSGTPPL